MRVIQSGFTLVELLVTLAVAAIVISMAVPSFRETIRSTTAAQQRADLVLALKLARSEAVTRARSVHVCASETGNECSTQWSQGWIVYVDNVGDGSVSEVLRYFRADGRFAIEESSASTNISFSSLGLPNSVANFNLTDEQSTAIDLQASLTAVGIAE